MTSIPPQPIDSGCCPICQEEELGQPVKTDCGHWYCYACLEHTKKATGKCALCLSSISDDTDAVQAELAAFHDTAKANEATAALWAADLEGVINTLGTDAMAETRLIQAVHGQLRGIDFNRRWSIVEAFLNLTRTRINAGDATRAERLGSLLLDDANPPALPPVRRAVAPPAVVHAWTVRRRRIFVAALVCLAAFWLYRSY
ncbi:MAG: hypothetical protein KDK78_06720 [Chlamydiia bacterium]|nr:hypothetical protein [Chlamydiia bacterium]